MQTITNVLISTIQPYEKNAKKHPAKQIKQVADSIREFGFNQPIVVDKDNIIIVGHGRYEAAKLLGMEEVPVLQVSLSEKKAKAYRLADNKLNESDWDMQLAIEELKSLDQEMVGLTGFDTDLLLSPDERDNDAPPLPDVAKSKVGEIYKLGNHRVMCGSSTVIENIEKLMDGKKADMVFTDPPYNVDYAGQTKEISSRKILNDKFENKEKFYQFLYDAISAMRQFVLGDVYIAMSSSELHTLQKAFTDCAGHWSTFIIWIKNTFTLGRSNYQRQYEPILYGWFEGSSHYWSGRRNLGDIVKEQMREEQDGSMWLKIQEGGGRNRYLAVR